MTTLTATYCSVCAWFNRRLQGFIDAQARVGRARAAQHLANMGYYEEAKKVMLDED